MTVPEGVVIYVQPRASRTEVVGPHGDAIKIRLRAPPVDGAANGELVAFLAKRLGVRREDVRIIGGITQRRKRVAISGWTARDVIARLTGGA